MKRGVFFDFDSTITTPIKLHRFKRHAIADQPQIFASMSAEEIVSNFGGRLRVPRLSALFKGLADGGTDLYIVSLGFRDSCIFPHLRAVGLSKYIQEEHIFGQDIETFQLHKFVKADLIAEIMSQRGWSPVECLFVDDTLKHVEIAAARGLCDVVKVAGKGLSPCEMDAVLAIGTQGMDAVRAAWNLLPKLGSLESGAVKRKKPLPLPPPKDDQVPDDDGPGEEEPEEEEVHEEEVQVLEKRDTDKGDHVVCISLDIPPAGTPLARRNSGRSLPQQSRSGKILARDDSGARLARQAEREGRTWPVNVPHRSSRELQESATEARDAGNADTVTVSAGASRPSGPPSSSIVVTKLGESREAGVADTVTVSAVASRPCGPPSTSIVVTKIGESREAGVADTVTVSAAASRPCGPPSTSIVVSKVADHHTGETTSAVGVKSNDVQSDKQSTADAVSTADAQSTVDAASDTQSDTLSDKATESPQSERHQRVADDSESKQISKTRHLIRAEGDVGARPVISHRRMKSEGDADTTESTVPSDVVEERTRKTSPEHGDKRAGRHLLRAENDGASRVLSHRRMRSEGDASPVNSKTPRVPKQQGSHVGEEHTRRTSPENGEKRTGRLACPSDVKPTASHDKGSSHSHSSSHGGSVRSDKNAQKTEKNVAEGQNACRDKVRNRLAVSTSRKDLDSDTNDSPAESASGKSSRTRLNRQADTASTSDLRCDLRGELRVDLRGDASGSGRWKLTPLLKDGVALCECTDVGVWQIEARVASESLSPPSSPGLGGSANVSEGSTRSGRLRPRGVVASRAPSATSPRPKDAEADGNRNVSRSRHERGRDGAVSNTNVRARSVPGPPCSSR